MQEIRVKNADQELVFNGELLGAATSWAAHKGRWHELFIYKTAAEQYVIARIGRSDVFHSEGCRRTKTEDQDLITKTIDGDLLEILMPCDRCRPDLAIGVAALVEPDKTWAAVAPTPQAAIAALHHNDRDNIKYIPDMARRLLHDVMKKDASLYRAYQTHFAIQSVS